MSQRRVLYAAVALIAGIVLCASSALANAQSPADLERFRGRVED